MLTIQEVIIVEGTHDRDRVKKAVDADVIVTGGSHIQGEVFDQIARVIDTRGVIILTDPDYAGEQIRRRITKRFPTCKQAFIPKVDAIVDGDIGVENASVTAVEAALSNVRTLWAREPIFFVEDLFEAQLAGNPYAAMRRAKLGALLGVGYGNVKAFLGRLNALSVTREEFQAAIIVLDGGNNER
nr:ribonuclease M5 [Bacilli bacterium]